jgi:hypothetical protein
MSENTIENTPRTITSEIPGEYKLNKVIESLEMAAIQKTTSSGINVSDFSTEQKDRLLDIMIQNEDNAFQYNMKRLSVSENLNSKALNASIVNQKTVRFILIGGGIAVFILIILIIFFKPEFFNLFISFIAGVLGGFGLKSVFASLRGSSKITISDEEEGD